MLWRQREEGISLATHILCHSNRERGGCGGLSPLRETALKICQPRREGGSAAENPEYSERGEEKRWYGGGVTRSRG